MSVDLPGAVSQVPVPERQRDRIACGRNVSGFVIVSVALAHPNRHPVPASVVHAHCLRVVSLAGETFPSSLESATSPRHIETARPLLVARVN
jgi:hypothetical protein